MLFSGDPRRRSVALLAGGLLLILVLLGALQAFNTTLPVRIWHYSFNVDFLNPETAGETLLSTGLIVLVFLLLLLLLVLLLRNILKVYAGQGRQRAGGAAALAHGAGRGADRAGARGDHVSVQLSADEPVAGPLVLAEHSELREDSTRVVVELAHYVASNARGEAESITATGAPDGDLPVLQLSWPPAASRSITDLLSSTARTSGSWPAFRRRRSPALPA
jgi:two-component system nitrogen regulation sensor histidine kinase NtrY